MTQKSKPTYELMPQQERALHMLESGENVFLTGGAGSGKSFLVRHFIKSLNAKTFPVLASTGAAAVLLGGRTFHSFFGLGIMDGGPKETLARLQEDDKVLRRLEKIEGIIIDEISMITGAAFAVAEQISQIARDSSLPWGGLRVIVVGDFAQLPPVTRSGPRDWCFLTSAWQRSGFMPCYLSHNKRVNDREFLDILSDVRIGQVTPKVEKFLEERLRVHDEEDFATRLFPRRDQADHVNRKKLEQIPFPETVIDSIFLGEERILKNFRLSSPLPEQIRLKPEARVMFVQNDPQQRWINGTRGWIREIKADKITVEKDSGRDVTVEKTQFSLQNAEGKVLASVINFPLALAYATTIHKSQGATIDDLWLDLEGLWEPGHAYVALSRLPRGEGLKLLRWSRRSFMVDAQVQKFYAQLEVENVVSSS